MIHSDETGHRDLADSTRRQYRHRLDHDLDAIMALAPTRRDGRELRPTATYRKVTGGFRSDWGADRFAAVRSVIGTAKRRGIDAYQAIYNTLRGQSVIALG